MQKILVTPSLPERLWGLLLAIFSGGEQQCIDVAPSFTADHLILLPDEPAAPLDRRNRQAVIQLIRQKKAEGAAILTIFHDEELANRIMDVRVSAPAAAKPAIAR